MVGSKRTHVRRQRVRLPWNLVDTKFSTKDIAVASYKHSRQDQHQHCHEASTFGKKGYFIHIPSVIYYEP